MDAVESLIDVAAPIASKGKSGFVESLVRLVKEGNGQADAIEAFRVGCLHGSQSPFALAARALDQNLLDENQYQQLVADQLNVPWHSEIGEAEADPVFVERIPIRFARRHRLLGLRTDNGCTRLVTSTLGDLTLYSHVSAVIQRPILLELAPSSVIDQAINHAYSDRPSDFEGVLAETGDAKSILNELDKLTDTDLLDDASRAPVIKLVNMVLFEAVKRRASDVHIQPTSTNTQVRFRIDGVLYDFLDISSHLLDEIVSRIKIIGGMDIAEKRIAQDGRTSVAIGEKSVDLRISIVPTSRGERVVLRLLDKSARLYGLSELGMSDDELGRFGELLQRTHGIILVTGPTGSGKSTTLYAALQHLDSTEKNILTLEDPIEYQLPGISQTQVAQKKGMTFATGLRAVLRQDPDIIMVGEIRDEETARMAIQSSMTGHLVFSTLHTNDAAGAVSRLLDLGVEPYLVASSLAAVVAQRLVRVVCPECGKKSPLEKSAVDSLRLDASCESRMVAFPNGCSACTSTGYYGRRGIFELLVVDDATRELIMRRAKASTIKQRAIENGMRTLRQDGIERLLGGKTSVEEVTRVTYADESMSELD